ncbi:palmitoyltransferase AKR1-like [Haliotis rufescens]|uniref:palmitoyltransferase AKR1-like n=1 Tax=Haliotis rufescens TaxID=6454 RepID=UPI00201F6557|nr:palmitoyltransferase AKR1-like [Haliotis rufescens]
MLSLCSSNCCGLQLALTATVFILFGISACCSKKCGFQMTEQMAYRSFTIRNIGITLCQVRCVENCFSSNFEYVNETSDCPSYDAKKLEKTSRLSVHPKNHPNVPVQPCSSKVCNPPSRCSETGSGKAVCEQASNDPSHGERAAQTTTVTTHASSDPSQTASTPVTTTKKPATQATPSPADCEHLCDASKAGNLEEVKRLVSQGVDVNCRWGGWSMTLVMWAAYGGHRDVVELLVSEGADVSLVTGHSYNTLHYACWGGHLETVKFVLSLHVVDIDARNNRGLTAADLARRRGHTRVLDLLVSRGAQ